jgi:hypothetical protein
MLDWLYDHALAVLLLVLGGALYAAAVIVERWKQEGPPPPRGREVASWTPEELSRKNPP